MSLKLETGLGDVEQPLSLDVVKAHLRVDGDDEDEYIGGLIDAWRSSIEGKDGWLGRALTTQQWIMVLDNFPPNGQGEINIPLPPLQSIDAVKYYNTAGQQITMAPGEYFLDNFSEPARIFPAYGQSWPAVLDRMNAVEITFTAGYGDAPDDIPAAIRHAGLLTIGHWYANRESVVVGGSVSEMPQAADYLLRSYKIYVPVVDGWPR